MSHRPVRARLARALPLALAAAAVASPAAALAADAPTRRINLSPENRLTTNSGVVAISADGREVILNQFRANDATATTSKPPRIVIRDQVAGKTTVLSEFGETALAASTDLNRILFLTPRALSSDDKNTTQDLYVYDRKTKAVALVSRAKTGGPALGQLGFYGNGALSGDGKAVLFTAGRAFSTPIDATVLRFEVATGQISTVTAGAELYAGPTDAAGKIALTKQGVFVGTKKLALPADVADQVSRTALVTPDGRFILGWRADTGGGAVEQVLIDTTNSTVRTLKLAPPLDTYFAIKAINAAGTEAIAEGGPSESITLRKVNLLTGTSVQYGGTLPYNQTSGETVLSANWAYWANVEFLAQVGPSPIPGTAVAPTRPPASEYLSFDPGCRANPYTGKPARRPSITLRGPNGDELGYPFPQPTKADVKVTITATGVVANAFTLAYGATRSLTTPFGGFTVAAKVTFPDGVSSSLNIAVKAYTPDICF